MTAIISQCLARTMIVATTSPVPSSFILGPMHRPITWLVSLQSHVALRKPMTCHRTLTSAAASGGENSPSRNKLVFLGTPGVAALVLSKLINASKDPDASFEIAAVVSQPGRPRGRNRVAQPSPVESMALTQGVPADKILCPVRAGEPEFLEALRNVQPDLCVTAAYGNYLPTTFLSIPRCGTLNIHPSLLPKYRGAAPVQRALQDGLEVTGVSLLYTVKEMDAGPILAQENMSVPHDIRAPELLTQLFSLGTDLLLKRLDDVWSGRAETQARPQDAAEATHAAKLHREEGLLNFLEPALVCHNKVRAFDGWPGTWATFELIDEEGNTVGEPLDLKVIKTRVLENSSNGLAEGSRSDAGQVVVDDGALRVVCGAGEMLEVLEVQVPGRKAVAARDFLNGLKGCSLKWVSSGAFTPTGGSGSLVA